MLVLLILGSLSIAIAMLLVVAGALLCIVGGMGVLGVALNTVSVINLVLAIGLSVDYSAHIAVSFRHQRHGTVRQRVMRAIETTGVYVFNGAATTFLAVVLLAFTSSYVFEVFFRMFFLTVLWGALFGLFFLPTLLVAIDSILPTRWKPSAHDRPEVSEQQPSPHPSGV